MSGDARTLADAQEAIQLVYIAVLAAMLLATYLAIRSHRKDGSK